MTEYLILLPLTVGAMTVHAVTGFGFAQFMAPVLVALHPGAEAVTAMLLLGLLVNGLIVVEGIPPGFRAGELAILIPGAVFGLPIGGLLLATADASTLQVLVGVSILLAAALQLRRMARRPPSTGHKARPARHPFASATVAAGLSGALTTATAVGAAPVILWLERRVDDAGRMRYAIALYSILLCVLGAAVLATQSTDDAGSGAVLALLLAPAVFAGHAAGRRLFRRLSATSYRAAVLGLVIFAGIASIAAALS
jgi:uncharacterized membrane protein YfcA